MKKRLKKHARSIGVVASVGISTLAGCGSPDGAPEPAETEQVGAEGEAPEDKKRKGHDVGVEMESSTSVDETDGESASGSSVFDEDGEHGAPPPPPPPPPPGGFAPPPPPMPTGAAPGVGAGRPALSFLEELRNKGGKLNRREDDEAGDGTGKKKRPDDPRFVDVSDDALAGVRRGLRPVAPKADAADRGSDDALAGVRQGLKPVAAKAKAADEEEDESKLTEAQRRLREQRKKIDAQ